VRRSRLCLGDRRTQHPEKPKPATKGGPQPINEETLFNLTVAASPNVAPFRNLFFGERERQARELTGQKPDGGVIAKPTLRDFGPRRKSNPRG
jgi:hypothetical protein